MKLAKALKEKNRKTTDLTALISKMTSNNSFLNGRTPDYDSREIKDQILPVLETFVQFKTQLFNASAPIRDKIFLMSELRSLINHVRTMSCVSGLHMEYHSESPLQYVASITEREKDEWVTALEARIAVLQDDIDQFNATTDLVLGTEG